MQSKSKLVVFALTAALMAASPIAFAQTKAEKTAAKAAPAPSAAPAAPQSAKVNGVAIPSAYFDAMNKEREASGQPSTPDVGNAIKDELVNREILSQAARKKGLDKTALVSAQMDMARQAVLIRAFFDDHVKANPITDAQLKTDYDKFVAQMGDKEYKARHVLVETEDEAKAVIASLGKGDSFEKVAKDKSKDTGSKDNGGDLDWGPAGRYVPEFGNAMKALKKGETTKTAVKSPFGFHVIRLDDVRDMKVPAFTEVKDNFKQRAQQEQITKLVQELRSKATVE
jgi:peptidyl-prolyl cis-trans isomerase C